VLGAIFPGKVTLGGKEYEKDNWFNVPDSIANSLTRGLHNTPDHPISITRSIVESKFPSPTFKHYNEFSPIVSTHENFDSLGFPADHPGRSKTDTYYVNEKTVLRTHTSAHELAIFGANESVGYTISADVYRRDAIDKTHYPIFHQMEGARMWDRRKAPAGNVVQAIWEDIANLPTHNMIVEDPNPPSHPDRNPLQQGHSYEEAEAIAAHLKRSLELMVAEIFSRAKAAAIAADPNYHDEPLKVRWIEAYFPWTSPSWELEIFWQGDWLEVLGCGVVRQELLENAGVPSQLGWAFGIGLERIAMLLFEIPDIRLFWSQDARFLDQFKGVSSNLETLKRYVPFSKFPACYKDVAFWLQPSSTTTTSAAGGLTPVQSFHENDVMEIVREIGGDVVEDVRKTDEFTHPKTGRKSLCYRINYRSLERTLTNEEANEFHEQVRTALVRRLGVVLR
jgi:phenylalanyl-tRNA synthetase alpha chain